MDSVAFQCLLIAGAVVVSCLFAYSIIPFIIQNASRWQILDQPDQRKIHLYPIPRLGGAAIIPAIWLACALALILADSMNIIGSSQTEAGFRSIVTGLLLGCSGSFLLGFFDDLRHLNATQKLTAQILIAAIAVSFLPPVSVVAGIEIPSWAFTMFAFSWLVLLPNSVNLLDGVDGLTGSLAILLLACISILSLSIGEWEWLTISLPAIAAIATFLRFNWNPAKIFLGDSGSLSVGFLVGYMSLSFASFSEARVGLNPWLLVALVSVWLLDTGFAIIRRYYKNAPRLKLLARERPGLFFFFQARAMASVVRPDNRHIHHWLLSLGFSAPQVVGVIMSGWIGLFLFFSPLYSDQFKQPLYVAFGGLVIVGLTVWGILRRLRGLTQTPQKSSLGHAA